MFCSLVFGVIFIMVGLVGRKASRKSRGRFSFLYIFFFLFLGVYSVFAPLRLTHQLASWVLDTSLLHAGIEVVDLVKVIY
ncbi:MAG: hypothetical protein COC08_07475 [Maribacter sp.]|nr:MAG: hypothetical protein COC08_07475 [Maribacter sp.]